MSTLESVDPVYFSMVNHKNIDYIRFHFHPPFHIPSSHLELNSILVVGGVAVGLIDRILTKGNRNLMLSLPD